MSGAGKSGLAFFISPDSHLLIKACEPKELKALTDMLAVWHSPLLLLAFKTLTLAPMPTVA